MNESKERKALKKTKKNVITAMKDENDDIGEYAKAAKMARKVGDKRAARTFSSIRKDEIEHKGRLKKLSKKY
jgi:rubrerythrin